MKLEYDPIGDILYLESVPPYSGQRTKEVAEGVLTRCNPSSGRVESTEVQGFVSRSRVGLLPVHVPMPGSASRIVVDYEADSHSVVLRDQDASASTSRAVKLDTLSAEYEAELAERASSPRRAIV